MSMLQQWWPQLLAVSGLALVIGYYKRHFEELSRRLEAMEQSAKQRAEERTGELSRLTQLVGRLIDEQGAQGAPASGAHTVEYDEAGNIVAVRRKAPRVRRPTGAIGGGGGKP
jgi:hypothetical protein